MSKVIDFRDYTEEPDIASMDRQALLLYLEQLREKISTLDAVEPEDMVSEAYEDWGQQHEELEDLVDEVLDRMEALD